MEQDRMGGGGVGAQPSCCILSLVEEQDPCGSRIWPLQGFRDANFHRNSGLQHISSNRYSAAAESKGKRGTKRGFSVAGDLGVLL